MEVDANSAPFIAEALKKKFGGQAVVVDEYCHSDTAPTASWNIDVKDFQADHGRIILCGLGQNIIFLPPATVVSGENTAEIHQQEKWFLIAVQEPPPRSWRRRFSARRR
jgi:hypothetical protein